MTTPSEIITQIHALFDQLSLSFAELVLRNDNLQAQVQAQADEITQLKAQLEPPSPFPLKKLILSDHFDAPTLDTTKWTAKNGWAGGNEQSICWARNVSISSDGNLVIQPKREQTTTVVSGQNVTRQFTSGYLTLRQPLQRPFAVETRCQLPLKADVSAGMWPAGWSRSLTGKGEIDKFEFFEIGTGANPEGIKEAPHGKLQVHVYGDTNTGLPKAGGFASGVIDPTQMHYYGLMVDADGSVHVYLDRKEVATYLVKDYPWLATAFTGGYDFRLNLQIGSKYYGNPNSATDFSQKMVVDYVDVYGS